MAKEAIFTMKLEPDLRAAFVAEAAAIDRPASQVLRELMREFIARQQSAREYDEFLRARVALGREQACSRTSIFVQTHHELGMVTGPFSGDNLQAPRGRSHAVQRLQSGPCAGYGVAINWVGEAGKAWIGRDAHAGILSAL